jgi:hypothetical protein
MQNKIALRLIGFVHFLSYIDKTSMSNPISTLFQLRLPVISV